MGKWDLEAPDVCTCCIIQVVLYNTWLAQIEKKSLEEDAGTLSLEV